MGHDQLIRNETNPPAPGPFFAKLWLVIIFFGSSIIFNIFNSCVKDESVDSFSTDENGGLSLSNAQDDARIWHFCSPSSSVEKEILQFDLCMKARFIEITKVSAFERNDLSIPKSQRVQSKILECFLCLL